MDIATTHKWLLEPSIPDDTFAGEAGDYNEHTLDWLARSTNARARECRRLLNELIAHLPPQDQEGFIHNLRHRWHSTFFELMVFRVLEELGASLTIEMPNPDSRQPDYTAEFPDATVIVEAVAPLINEGATKVQRYRLLLRDYIESKIPDGWRVEVWEVPDISPNASKKTLKRLVDRVLDVPPPCVGERRREICEECEVGRLHLHLYPLSESRHRLEWLVGVSYVDNTLSRIEYVLDRKVDQVRNSPFPVLLAIHAPGSDAEDFDRVLYGNTFSQEDINRIVVETGFQADGLFNKSSEKSPVFAGVLAFFNVGFNICDGPVLYQHPRFLGQLPEAIVQLEQRTYNAVTNAIESEPSEITDLSKRLNLVMV